MINEELLLGVQKPAQYIGNEWNLPDKSYDKAYIKCALCFPDLYEIGMSNLGIRIIYHVLNSIPDSSCERFFSPSSDMEEVLRRNNLEITSLETGRRLRDFDIIGFSLAHELNYTNVLNMLSMGNIPLKSSLRDGKYPLVIAGGPCVLNPEPLHDFFDAFIIGEAEDVIIEVVDVYRSQKEKSGDSFMSKEALLCELARIEGVYVPSLYETGYSACGKVNVFKPRIPGIPRTIKKRYVKDLNKVEFPLRWIIPYVQVVHDRISVEIMRGCPNQCRFCQARNQYYPLRYREKKNVADMICEMYRQTGYEEISLGGLSVSDYPGIEDLLSALIDFFKIKAVSISLPSIKPRLIVGESSALIATIKKTGLTFAPEAGSARLRKILNKEFDEQDFFSVLEKAYSAGYQHVKLYFMTGIPGETDEDIDAIADFTMRVSQLKKKVKGSPAQVNITVNTLVPKPHTPLQWAGMQTPEAILSRQKYLKGILNSRRVKINVHDRNMSFIEGVLSRGDRKLSEVIFLAFLKGARFDSWNKSFDFDKWTAAFNEAGIDPYFYIRQKRKDELLPWDFIDVGVSKDFLLQEADKANC